jgi:hypothetical protein
LWVASECRLRGTGYHCEGPAHYRCNDQGRSLVEANNSTRTGGGRGSDVVIVARSENGLVPGRILDAMPLLRGVPVHCANP